MGIRRKPLVELFHVLVEQAMLRQPVSELVEFVVGGQLAVDQQIGHFDERRLLGQFADRIASVAQDPVFAIDKGDGALARTRVAVAGIKRDGATLATQLRDIDPYLSLGTDRNG